MTNQRSCLWPAVGCEIHVLEALLPDVFLLEYFYADRMHFVFVMARNPRSLDILKHPRPKKRAHSQKAEITTSPRCPAPHFAYIHGLCVTRVESISSHRFNTWHPTTFLWCTPTELVQEELFWLNDFFSLLYTSNVVLACLHDHSLRTGEGSCVDAL